MSHPILLYHQVGPESAFGRRLNAPAASVEAIARLLARRARWSLLDHWPPDGPSFAITFDDGFLGACTAGAEALERAGVRGVFYAIAGRLGAPDADWAGGKGPTPRPLADAALLRVLQGKGHAIGNHTVTHPRLTEISEDEARREIEVAQAMLLSEGLRPRSFAHPYGSEAGPTDGFATVATLRKGPATGRESDGHLPRIVMAYSDGPAALLYKWRVRPALRRAGL